jgi:hypothetical protein
MDLDRISKSHDTHYVSYTHVKRPTTPEKARALRSSNISHLPIYTTTFPPLHTTHHIHNNVTTHTPAAPAATVATQHTTHHTPHTPLATIPTPHPPLHNHPSQLRRRTQIQILRPSPNRHETALAKIFRSHEERADEEH